MDEDEDEAVEEIPVDDVPVTVDDVALQLSEPLEASTPKEQIDQIIFGQLRFLEGNMFKLNNKLQNVQILNKWPGISSLKIFF